MTEELLPSGNYDGPSERTRANGVAAAALWVGIAACLAAFFPLATVFPMPDVLVNSTFLTWPTMVLGGILGLSLAVIGLRKTSAGRATNRTTAKVGLMLSLVALEMSAGWVALNLANMPS